MQRCQLFPSKPLYYTTKRQRRISIIVAANTEDPYKTLRISKNATRKQIKTKYYELIKELHPDVNQDRDTTQLAAKLNTAYQNLMDQFPSLSSSIDTEEEQDDVFDRPETEPNLLFINPFSCYGVPLQEWQQLQDIVRANADDPEAALRALGVGVSEGAIYYLTPAQLKIVETELETAAMSMNRITEEACAYFLSDCLLRARVANNRVVSSF